MNVDERVRGEGPVKAYQRGWDDAKEEASKIIAEHEEQSANLHDDYAELLSCATGILTYSPKTNAFKIHWDAMKRHVRDALKLSRKFLRVNEDTPTFLDNCVPSPPDWTPKEWQRILGASIAERDKVIHKQHSALLQIKDWLVRGVPVSEQSDISTLVTQTIGESERNECPVDGTRWTGDIQQCPTCQDNNQGMKKGRSR